MHPLAVAGLVALATSDSWAWYASRVATAPEEALSLALAVGFLGVLALPRLSRGEALVPVPLAPVALLLVAYAAASFVAPPIVRAAIAALALLFTLYRAVFGCRPPPAFWGLVALALPVLPSLQFVLGYPMRLVSASLTVALLSLQGLPVGRQGTYVVWRGELAQFDAPCSGVSMLWALVLVALMTSLVRRHDAWRTLGAVMLAGVAAIAANVLRVASLLSLEMGALGSPSEVLHEAIGVAAFVLAAGFLIWGSERGLSWSRRA